MGIETLGEACNFGWETEVPPSRRSSRGPEAQEALRLQKILGPQDAGLYPRPHHSHRPDRRADYHRIRSAEQADLRFQSWDAVAAPQDFVYVGFAFMRSRLFDPV
jgi:hypothetical protein